MPNPHIDYDALFAALAELSPSARQALSEERFRIHLEADEVDAQTVLEVLQECLTVDLLELGVVLTTPLPELFDTLYDFQRTLPVWRLILPSPLYAELRAQPELAWVLQRLVAGDLDNDEPTLQAYLRILAEDDPAWAAEYGEAVTLVQPHLTSTPLFDAYLRNLISLDASVSAPALLETDAVRAFTQQVEALRQRLLATLSDFARRHPRVAGVTGARQLVAQHIAWLLQPDTLNRNAWAFTFNTGDPSATQAQRTLAVQTCTAVLHSSPVSVDWYTLSGTPIDEAAALAIAAHHVATDSTGGVWFRETGLARLGKIAADGGVPIAPPHYNLMALMVPPGGGA